MAESYTAEEIAHQRRMESIFSPLAARQREEKRLKDNPDGEGPDNRGQFAHYTSADAAFQMVRSKRLWMRSTTCIADYREVDHGHDIPLKYFQNNQKAEAFFAAFDSVGPGVAKAAIEYFDKAWAQLRLETYITCVSDHSSKTEDELGRLSMWRAFVPGNARVALIFSVPWFTRATEALGVLFSPVAYLSEAEAHAVTDGVVANILREAEFLRSLPAEEVHNWVVLMLVAAVCCLKHEGFAEEQEWRGVAPAAYPRSSLLKGSIETIHGVPQTVYKIPFDEKVDPRLADLDLSRILHRFIIGPTPYAWVMYKAFVDELRQAGVPDPESRVWTSNIPLRDKF